MKLPLLNEHIRYDRLVSSIIPSIYWYQILKYFLKRWTTGMDRFFFFFFFNILVPYGSKLHIPPTIYHLLAAQHTSPLGVGVEKWGERETDRERERELYLEFVSRFSLTNRVMLIVHCSVHNRSSLNANVWYTWYYFTNARPPTPPSTPSPTPSFLFVCLFACFTDLRIQAGKLRLWEK